MYHEYSDITATTVCLSFELFNCLNVDNEMAMITVTLISDEHFIENETHNCLIQVLLLL